MDVAHPQGRVYGKKETTEYEYEYEPLDELIATPPFFDFLFYSVETDRYLASRPVR